MGSDVAICRICLEILVSVRSRVISDSECPTTPCRVPCSLFLFMFATTKVLQSTLALPSLELSWEKLAEEAFDIISGCSYITLLLFLEMHWRQILKPLSAMRSKRKTWSVFWTVNVLLYVVVFVVAFVEVRSAELRVRLFPYLFNPYRFSSIT